MDRAKFLKRSLAVVLSSTLSSTSGISQYLTNGKHLIVYLSRTNNTKAVAEMIEKEIGGDLVTIEPKQKYPEDYQTIVDQVVKENENGYLPPLETRIDSIREYDVIFIGYPTWGMQLPPPMKSFLSSHNFKGKVIVPFNTNAGYGLGNSVQTIQKLCPESKVLKAFETKGGVERDGVFFVMEGEKEKQVRAGIRDWLRNNGMN